MESTSRRNKQGWNNPLKSYDEVISDCLKYNHKSGVFHFFLLKKMHCLTLNQSNIIRRKDAVYIITRSIPKRLADTFLKEMEEFNLIKITNKQSIRLLK